MRLHIDQDSIRKCHNNIFTGTIYVEVGDKQFPEKNWNDFFLIILNFWLQEIVEMKKSSIGNGNFSFMDGPLKFTVKKNENLWVMEGTNQNNIIINENINFVEFEKSVLLEALNTVKNMRKKNGLVMSYNS
jgi:hypothetical protein